MFLNIMKKSDTVFVFRALLPARRPMNHAFALRNIP